VTAGTKAQGYMSDIAAAAYQLTTGAVIKTPYDWQTKAYERLSLQESDASYLITTPTGAGKTEAVTIPGLGPRRGGAPRRLYLIGDDNAPLDDYLYRLVPYLKTASLADNTPRTVYVDTPRGDTTPIPCRRFLPEGGSEEMVVLNPLEADVDLVLTSLARFREIFFGGGGLHALPSALTMPGTAPGRRDLFYFDEAHSYETDAFEEFQRLVEFLFAADMDVVVGSSTLSDPYRQELGFLEPLDVPEVGESGITLEYHPDIITSEHSVRLALSVVSKVSRVVVVTEDAEAAIEVFTELHQSGQHDVLLYLRRQPPHERRAVYAEIKQRESEGKGYVLVTTGTAIESGDISADVLITTFCLPESLILRAGRCRRKSKETGGKVIVLGHDLTHAERTLNPTLLGDYKSALKEMSDTSFQANDFKNFI